MTFRVFHHQTREYQEYAFMDEAVDGFPEQHVFVAEVDADSLGEVFAKTNTIDRAWWENDGVRLAEAVTGTRSTSVGDVIVDDDGIAHGVLGVGFRVLGRVCRFCGLKRCFAHCAESDDGKHEPDWTSLRLADEGRGVATGLLDVSCANCEVSGAASVTADDVTWD